MKEDIQFVRKETRLSLGFIQQFFLAAVCCACVALEGPWIHTSVLSCLCVFHVTEHLADLLDCKLLLWTCRSSKKTFQKIGPRIQGLLCKFLLSHSKLAEFTNTAWLHLKSSSTFASTVNWSKTLSQSTRLHHKHSSLVTWALSK